MGLHVKVVEKWHGDQAGAPGFQDPVHFADHFLGSINVLQDLGAQNPVETGVGKRQVPGVAIHLGLHPDRKGSLGWRIIQPHIMPHSWQIGAMRLIPASQVQDPPGQPGTVAADVPPGIPVRHILKMEQVGFQLPAAQIAVEPVKYRLPIFPG